jgi:hypothetical protein
LIEANTISNPNVVGIRVLTNLGPFKEGVGGFNVIVRSNTIEDTGSINIPTFPGAAISAYGITHSNHIPLKPVNKYIWVVGNTVRRAQQGCISVAASEDVKVNSNLCDTTNTKPIGANAYSINILNSSRVEVEENHRTGASTGAIKVDSSVADAHIQEHY